MQRLKSILAKHSNWEPYNEYIVRIEGFASTDFTLCVENAKALLEGISKEVCVKKGVTLDKNSKMSGLLKTAFKSGKNGQIDHLISEQIDHRDSV